MREALAKWAVFLFAAVLGSTGLTISTYLSLVYVAGDLPPCLEGDTCADILTSRYSHIGPLPIALFGAFYYLVGLSTAPALVTRDRAALLKGLIWSSLGFVGAAILTALSLTRLHGVCIWCLASAFCMAMLFALWGLAASSQVGDAPVLSRKTRLWMILLPAVSGLAEGGSLAVGLRTSEPSYDASALAKISIEKLVFGVPCPAKPAATQTLVFFGDVECGACRYWFPRIRLRVDRTSGIRLVFRAKTAGNHDNGLRLVRLLMQLPSNDQDSFLRDVFADESLDSEATHSIIERWSGMRIADIPAAAIDRRLQDDIDLTRSLGILRVPTIVWVDSSGRKEVMSARRAYARLAEPVDR